LRVSGARRTHILDGDATGGGHGPGRGTPDKSEFPAPLTDDEIIAGVEVLAHDLSKYPGGVLPSVGSYVLHGNIKGVRAVVVVNLDKMDLIRKAY